MMDQCSDTEGDSPRAYEPLTLNLEVFDDDESSDEDSSGALEIVTSENELTDSNVRERKRKREDSIDNDMPEVLNNMEEEIEQQLDAKAAKSNLTVANVKNILKHVITNEHVLAMVRRTVKDGDSDDDSEDEFTYEPKLTRAKTKELLKTQPAISWPITPIKQQSISKCHVLIERELSEDSSDEEYRPNEDDEGQSDEEKENESIATDLDTEPPTPTSVSTPKSPKSSNDCATQTNWSEDGLFKIPQENIGQRTRSKLSLSDTPLEAIEKAFVPPDITTDMYDSECDDEDWKDFLNNFTEPLTTEAADDDEADPEYNVLADEEQAVDKEELRVDRAVKVSRKELNLLMAELFEYTDMISSDDEDTRTQQQAPQVLPIPEEFPLPEEQLPEQFTEQQESAPESVTNVVSSDSEEFITLSTEQRLLLDQQMRKHIQLTTQHFLQSYCHPELSECAADFKSILLSLKFLAGTNTKSAFNAANLDGALQLIETWEQKLRSSSPESNTILSFMQGELKLVNEFKKKRRVYHSHFPPELMNLISHSEVFLYPLLLPTLPFRSENLSKTIYVPPEDSLIAIGLEQFEEYIQDIGLPSSKKPTSNRSDVLPLITQYLMPCKDPKNLYFHIRAARLTKPDPSNPIQYYFEHKAAPKTDHYVIPFTADLVRPPSKQPQELLPDIWREYLHHTEIKTEPSLLLWH